MVLFLTERLHLPRLKLHITNSTLQDYSLPNHWLTGDADDREACCMLGGWSSRALQICPADVSVGNSLPGCRTSLLTLRHSLHPRHLCGWPWTRTVALLPTCPALPARILHSLDVVVQRFSQPQWGRSTCNRLDSELSQVEKKKPGLFLHVAQNDELKWQLEGVPSKNAQFKSQRRKKWRKNP